MKGTPPPQRLISAQAGIDRWSMILGLIIATCALLYIRRPDQFLYPYIWVESGPIHLPLYIQGGFWNLLQPVNGYINFASKLIDFISFKVSFLYYPEVSTALVSVFTCLIVLSIAYAPTHLRLKPLCALIPLLIPTNSEVFGISLYAFWWGTLLLFLLLLWDVQNKSAWLRSFYMGLGGLCSPVIIPLSGLFWIRALLLRKPIEMGLAGIASLTALIQLISIKKTHTNTEHLLFHTDYFSTLLQKFGGYFMVSPAHHHPFLYGCLLLTLLLVAIVINRHTLDRFFYVLLLCIPLMVVLSVLRVDLTVIDAMSSGPRYFFYPFILIGWVLCWLIAESRGVLRYILILCLAQALWHGTHYWTRTHDRIDWRAHIRACMKKTSEDYVLPIHVEGDKHHVWTVKISGTACRRLVNESLV